MFTIITDGLKNHHVSDLGLAGVVASGIKRKYGVIPSVVQRPEVGYFIFDPGGMIGGKVGYVSFCLGDDLVVSVRKQHLEFLAYASQNLVKKTDYGWKLHGGKDILCLTDDQKAKLVVALSVYSTCLGTIGE